MSTKSAKSSRIQLDEPKKTRLAYAKSVMYDSTIGAVKQGQIPFLDKFIFGPAYKLYKRSRGVSSKDIEAGIASDNEKIKNFTRKMKSALFSKKGGRKSRKNRSRKNRSRKNH